ncbi:MAG TPA: sulfatase-like hydrolase/transferase [Acidimicrobiales bacterium]
MATEAVTPAHDSAPPAPASRPGAARREAGLALELVALTAFVAARPLLGSLGRSPETFLARGADWTDVVVFTLLVVLVPAAAPVATGLAARLAGGRVRAAVHVLLVGALAGLAAWQLARDRTDIQLLPLGLPLGVVAGAGVAVLRHRTELLGQFLRYAAVAALLYPAQFLLASPTSAIVLGGRHGSADPEATAAVARAVGDDPPPVVLLIFDGLPTGLLLDGEGRIDAGLYPNLAALAGTGTWYRNHTTVAPMTLRAVPAILSGRLADRTVAPVTSRYPRNLFTLLGGVYDVHADEVLTGLCPVSMCPAPPGWPVDELVGDARELWGKQARGEHAPAHFVPGIFHDRQGRLGAWLAAQDFGRGERPDLFVVHAMLPHDPWWFLPDGSSYEPLPDPRGLFADHWGPSGAGVGRQRHVLQTQAVDTFVGRIMDEMRAAGRFDDALFVVTADHGYAFDAGARMRGLDERNVDDILWTPLIVKSPRQREPVVDDRNVLSVDVLPTMADELGVELPWEDLDGVPASEAARDPADKEVADWEWSTLRSGDGGPVAVDGEAGLAEVLAQEAVAGDGPLAVWDRTGQAHGELVGRQVRSLAAGAARRESVDVTELDRWADVDTRVPPLEIAGLTDAPAGTTVAVTVNGTVAAVVPAETGA